MKRPSSHSPADEHPIVFFDGHCGLCNKTVDWILSHDRAHVFRFAPLQGTTAQGLFEGVPIEELMRSFWLKEGDALSRKSYALLRVCRLLGGITAFAYVAIIVPRPLRDWCYDQIANRRYQIWGRSETCRIPSADERAYFLP